MAEGTRLVLIRHGESQAQVERFVSGHDTCTGLSERGRAQAEALRDRLTRTGELRDVSALYTSVLPRAIETAATISPAIGGFDAEQHCDWCEMHPGEAEGIHWDEFVERYGEFNGSDDRDNSFVPGAESVNEFVGRVERAIVRAVDAHPGETIAIVAHGGVIYCALDALLGLPYGSTIGYVENTSINEFTLIDGEWRLTRLNDAAHVHAMNGSR